MGIFFWGIMVQRRAARYIDDIDISQLSQYQQRDRNARRSSMGNIRNSK